jgi:hypothetical protein
MPPEAPATEIPAPATPFPVAETPEPAPTPAPQPEPGSNVPPALPAPLWFIAAGSGQVLRLERDGFTVTPVTSEAAPVEAFDVVGTLLALVTGNDLVLIDLAAGTRTVKVAGAPFDGEDYEAMHREKIGRPAISPDGSTIVFARNGIQTISTGADNTVTELLPNSPFPDFSDPDFEFPEGPLRIFGGATWSPDGQRLVVSFGYYPEAGNLGLYEMADGSFVDLGDLPVPGDLFIPTCCDATWSADSTTLWITSDITIYGVPGITRVDAIGRSLHPVIFHDFSDPDDTPKLFRSALPGADGSLLTFMGEAWEPGAIPPFNMTRVEADGTIAPFGMGLPTAWLYLGREALWSPDGSGIVLAETRYNSRWDDLGTLRWFYPDARMPLTLPITGHDLRWGSPVQPLSADPDLDTLRAQAATDFDVIVGEDVDAIDVVRVLSADRPLWAAFSTGFHSWDPPRGHFVALYEWSGSGWVNLGQIDLSDGGMVADEVVYSPDYNSAVTQAYLNREDVWLLVSGGVGAHGGLLVLLRHTGDALVPVATHFNSSPGAGFVEDVTGDGLHELVLDQTEAYIFCYACGVRLADYELRYWDGTALVSHLPEAVTEGGISAENREAINQALLYARAGLWSDVANTLYGVDGGSNAAARRTLAWLRLTEAGRALYGYESPYPLLSRLFYGDYPGATFSFYEMTPQQILDPAGPWLVGTVGEIWMDPWLPEIVAISDRALALQPDNAGAWFLRGWAKYVLNSADASARADIAQAAALNPANVIYTPVADYLATLP